MSVLIGIALKSLLIAGLTLGLLAAMRHRSAAERSWVAHIGLFALVVMALAPVVLPTWSVETPSLFAHTQAVQAPAHAVAASTAAASLPAGASAVPASIGPAASRPTISAAAAASAIYAIPAAILLLVTFFALARLIALQARADVLVDGHWLSALARAQRRMGFKHGTALLTSNELASPISWGVVRPVILLNTRAVEAAGEAEAIIAHELAHVARMDWAKLLLARIATALFWFNPLVWMLAREAHQLREETADDAVLAADIADTDYAQLLVGVARHECPGLLLGAHGVAPSKSSLARRVARVLDGKSVRGPVARSFAIGVFAGAMIVAAPLAAITLAPAGTAAQPKSRSSTLAANGSQSAYYPVREVPSDLPGIIASGVSASVETAAAVIAPNVAAKVEADPGFEAISQTGAKVVTRNGITVAKSANGAKVTIYPPNAQGLRRVVAVAPNGASSVSFADAGGVPGLVAVVGAPPLPPRPPRPPHDTRSALDRAIEMKAVGVTPEYVEAMRAASPALRGADADDLVQLKAVGVTPEYVRALASVGFGNLDADALTEARAVGVNPEYVRAMRAAGYGSTLDDFVEMRAVGVTPAYADQIRRAGYNVNLKKLVDLRANDIDLDDLRDAPAPPPSPPPLPRRH